jgi:Trk K+ transport system NAD-binding subunit
MEKPVILCGLGRVGWRVLDFFKAAGLPVVVVDINISPNDPRLVGVKAIKGDCRQTDVLEQAGIREASGVVIVTSEDLVNISAALLIRRLNPTARIVVRMFNQNLLNHLGGSVSNIIALSVSALTAPLLALIASTGDVLGAFKLDVSPRQISELLVIEGSDLLGKRIVDVARQFNVTILAYYRPGGTHQFLLDVDGDSVLSVGDRLILCGVPGDISQIIARERGDLFPGIRWAGIVRRWFRTAKRTLLEVDLAVKIATPVLILTIVASTLVFRYGLGSRWSDGLYSTVSLVATGADLHGENHPEWAKVFLSILKIAGAALIAAFTAILTQYLIRARLGGVLEIRRVPDGGHIVVCGIGNVGYRLINELTSMGERVVAIDKVNENAFIATVRRKGVPTFVGDATVVEVLKQAHAESAKAVIAATSNELANLEIALLVRGMNPKQRVVLRLHDPGFAEAVRDAAKIRFALSVPALAAPAFAAALFGDHVQTIFTVAGRTMVVIDVIVEPNETFLDGKSLRALVLDYRLLPIAVRGREAGSLKAYRLKVGDRITLVAELHNLERFVRRQPIPKTCSVVVKAYDATAKDYLATLLRTAKHCSSEEVEALLQTAPFTLAADLTRGEAQELVEQLSSQTPKTEAFIQEK